MDLGIEGLGEASEIGAGASAVVYRAHQHALGRDVAVKVLTAADATFIRRFEREAKVLGRLSQILGIVTVYGTGLTAAGRPYLVMELCASSFHDQVSEAGVIDPSNACRILSGVARAVEEAHGIGVVHRDLKPANILVSVGGTHLVADFGISTIGGTTMGQTNAVAFTAGYVAPETLEGSKSGPPADVYALGATLFHALTGAPPFVDPDGEPNIVALANRVVNQPVRDLRPQGVPRPVCAVIEAAMVKDPSLRPTAAELAALLDQVDAEPATSGATRPAPVPLPGPVGEGQSVQGFRSGLGSAGAAGADSAAGSAASPGAGGSANAAGKAPDVGAGAAGRVGGYGYDTSSLADQSIGHATDATSVLGPLDDATLHTANDHAAQHGAHAWAAPADTLPRNRPVQVGSAGPVGPNAATAPPLTGAAGGSNSGDSLSQATKRRRNVRPWHWLVVGALGLAIAATVVALRAGPPDAGDEVAGATPAEAAGEGDEEDPGPVAGAPEEDDEVRPVNSEVPSVVGLLRADAEGELIDAGFEIGEVNEANHATIGVGGVVDTAPEGGSLAANGSTVDLLVSLGPAEPTSTSVVIDVDGLTIAEAVAELEDDGFVVGRRVQEESDTVPPGTVIRSFPPRSTEVEIGATVDLFVSSGPGSAGDIEVPDLVGLPFAEAERILLDDGFTVERVELPSEGIPIGQVFGTDPTAGTLVASGSAVRVQTALGEVDPCLTLFGVEQSAAEALLSANGHKVLIEERESDSVPAGHVNGCGVDATALPLVVTLLITPAS